jgi:hypothetical protein
MSDQPDMPVVPGRRRRWLRKALSLRAAMVLVLFIALALGWTTSRARRQARAVAALRQAGALVVYEDESESNEGEIPGKSGPPGWMTRWFGKDCFKNVVWARLELFPGNSEDSVIDHIEALDSLETLVLVREPSEAVMVRLRRMKNLKSLVMKDPIEVDRSDAFMKALGRMEQLKDLTLEVRLGDKTLNPLRSLKRLESLELVSGGLYSSGPSEDGLQSLSALKKLRRLDIVCGSGFFHHDLTPLREIPTLEALGFRCKCDAGAKHIPKLSRLRILNLEGTRISDDGIMSLGSMPHLEAINLSATQISDRGLRHLRGLDHLCELSLSATRVTDAGLRELQGMKALEMLDISMTDVGDDGLACLEKLTSLQAIDLGGTRVTNAGLAHLKAMSRLQEICLENTKIDDDGLETLWEIPARCKVKLTGTRVTAEGVARHYKAHHSQNMNPPDFHQKGRLHR